MIYFVDLEASSLMVGGFPIEVAWVDQDGQGEHYLTRPAECWLHPPEWSPASERLHGISMATLIAEGVPYERVARRVAATLARQSVMACSDAPGTDSRWLNILLETPDLRQRVKLTDVQKLYSWASRPLDALAAADRSRSPELAEQRVRNIASEIIARAEEEEALRPRVHHRALPDAESLWRTWRAIKDRVAQRLADEERDQ